MEKIEPAINVYRTEHYIVRQSLTIRHHDVLGTDMISEDMFLRRNPKRDRKYEKLFKDRDLIDGRRLPSTMCFRKYID